MSHPLYNRIFSVVVFGLLLVALPCGVKAFAVSPVLFDYTLNPGASVQGAMHITNNTEARQTYYASVQNFVAVGEEGRQEFLPDSDTSGLVSWVALDKKSVTLEAGKDSDFNFAIALPKDAKPGGHYAAIFFSIIPPDQKEGVGIGAKTGVLFLVNVSGEIREEAKVETFKATSRHGFFNRLPVDFELRLKNEGNVHFKPIGKIEIKNMFGGTVESIGVNPGESRVLPNSIRKVLSSWGPQDTLEIKGFWPELKAEWQGFAIGKYTANAEVVYGSRNQTAVASASFWVLPWRLAFALLVLLLLLALVFKGYNRMIVRKAMNKNSKG